jgi:N-alpha-acetyl-L-2,4-diaminobutyrate deacetylase
MMVRDPGCYSFARQVAFRAAPCRGRAGRAGERAVPALVEDVDHAPHEVKYGTSGTLWMAAGPGRVVRGDCVAVVMQDYEQPTG